MNESKINKDQIRNEELYYNKYIENMKRVGCLRDQLCLDELNTKIVTLLGGSKNTTWSPVRIRCPIGHKISIYGNDIEFSGHKLSVRLADIYGNEISQSTLMRIVIENFNDSSCIIDKITYKDIINDKYCFKRSFDIKNEQELCLYVINPDIDIDRNHITFMIEIDAWEYPTIDEIHGNINMKNAN